MQNVENNMDELFQKAAEKYPLKIPTGNFDDLMPFLGSANTATTAQPAIANGKRKTALLLLVFFITGITIATTYLVTKSSNNNPLTTNASIKEKLFIEGKNNTNLQTNINFTAPNKAQGKTTKPFSSLATYRQKNSGTFSTNDNMIIAANAPGVGSDDALKKQTDYTNNENSLENNKVVNTIEPQQGNNDVVVAVNKNDDLKKINNTKAVTTEQPKAQNKKNTNNTSGNKPSFYYGVAAGFEYNEVKNQTMTKAGLNGGIVLGLQIYPKIAIESGVQLSQKKYYSAGKFFKPKAGSMPANMFVNSVQSTSTIIEMPVSVKYNFSKKENTIYGKAGISTYIITKESNKYQAVVSGQQQEINSTYENNESYFASDLRISAGYQKRLAQKLNVRVEPFIQIPLRGIGVGNMPVTTMGMQLILTRN